MIEPVGEGGGGGFGEGGAGGEGGDTGEEGIKAGMAWGNGGSIGGGEAGGADEEGTEYRVFQDLNFHKNREGGGTGGRRLGASCGPGSGKPQLSGSLPSGTSIRLVADGGDAPTFDANGEVWGRLELYVESEEEWVTVASFEFLAEEAEVGCRQLGNELGYTPTSWSKVDRYDTPNGSGKQYFAYNCQGSEDELSSCGDFSSQDPAPHNGDVGLRCTFVVVGDECEECPAGKYRYVCVFVERRGLRREGERMSFACEMPSHT